MNVQFAAEPGGRNAWPEAVLFDLDGTLIDSAPDLVVAINKTLADSGLPPLDLKAVTAMIGNGISKLVERALRARDKNLAGEELAIEVARMIAHYSAGLVEHTKLYDDAAETVAAFHGAGVKTGVVTNKPQKAAEAVLKHFGLDAHLDVVVGGDAVINKKPAADIVELALQRIGKSPSQCLMVGDSAADVGSAQAAGVAVIVVEGGYTNVPAGELGADAVVASLEGLPAAIEKLRALV